MNSAHSEQKQHKSPPDGNMILEAEVESAHNTKTFSMHSMQAKIYAQHNQSQHFKIYISAVKPTFRHF